MQLSIVLSRIEAEETNGSEGRLQTEEKEEEEEMKRMISGIGEITTGQGKDRQKGSGLG